MGKGLLEWIKGRASANTELNRIVNSITLQYAIDLLSVGIGYRSFWWAFNHGRLAYHKLLIHVPHFCNLDPNLAFTSPPYSSLKSQVLYTQGHDIVTPDQTTALMQTW